MSLNSLVSIIIPNYNYAHLIGDTLESVKAQTYPYFECIVVDDGSTDNSVEVIQEFIKSDNRFQLLQKTNGGLPSTRNEGMKIAKGDYIAFLDADDLWKPNKLKNQLNAFKESEVDVVFSNCEVFDNNDVTEKSDFKQETISYYDLLGANVIPGSSSNLLMKKKVIESVGFFNNDLRSAEDLEYYFRIALAGFQYKYVSNIDVSIRKHSDSMQTNFLKMFYNKIYCFDLCLEKLKKSQFELDKDSLNNSLLISFQRMLWTARDCKRDDLIKLTYVRTRKLMGLKFYFSLIFWKNWKYDAIQKLVKFKKSILK